MLIEQVQHYLGSEQAGKWLLIVDNADDKTLLYDDNGIANSLPQAETGITLFTTRYKDLAFDLADGNILSLGEMNLEEAEMLLSESLRRANYLSQDTEAMKELLDELQYLPLAISQAASYMIKCSVPIPKYLTLMSSTEENMVKLLSRGFRDNTHDTRSTVAVTWLVSFEQIRKEEPGAALILFTLAFFENKAIPFEILPSVGSEGDLIHAIGILVGYSFLSRQGDGKMYEMHRLVHHAIKIWMQNQKLADQWGEQTIRHLVNIFPTHNWENRNNLWGKLTPHTIRALQSTEQLAITPVLRVDLCFKLGVYLREDFKLPEAIE